MVSGWRNKMSKDVIKIANCSGYYGDKLSAAKEMVDGGPIDVLTGDYLAELTMTILFNQKMQRGDDKGYVGTFLKQVKDVAQSCKEKNIKVLGKQALGMFMVGSNTMKAGRYISDHDQKIANKIAYVISGGDLSQATIVDEQYLLDLEREAFLSLCSERKTLERIQHILKTGKPLRN